MSTTRSVPLGLLVVVGVLAGCSAAPATPATPAPAAAPVRASASSTPGTSAADAAPVTGRCLLTDLRPAVGPTTGDAGQRHTTVVWTNASSSTCTMRGYGGVDLQGPPDPQTSTYSLPRQISEQPTLVRLAPGGTAHSVITWLPSPTARWTPTRFLVTPPDETHSAVLEWPGGAVVRQDGATHPGTFLGPVQAGAGT